MLAVAPTLRIPYPILLVLGGLAIGVVPGMPNVELEPELVFFGVLPPLLYSAAFFTSLRDLRANVRPIGLLAVGLVVMTTVGVAVVAHAFDRRADVAAAFVLGAIVSPTDPIAATAIARRLGVPAEARHDRRGREPGQRRHRPGPVPGRGRRGRDRLVLGDRTPAGSSSSAPAAASRSGSPSGGSCARFGAGSTTRRRRSRSHC